MESEKSNNLVERVKIIKETVEKLPISDNEKATAILMTATGANPDSIVRFLVYACDNAETKIAEIANPKKDAPDYYNNIEKIIYEMLTENTGASILDSGAIYGRHWERNRKIKDFKKTPAMYVEIGKDGIEYIAVNIFHFLVNNLDIDDTSINLEKRLYEVANMPENQDLSWLGVIEEFCEELKEEGWDYWVFNSYNGECLLSQGIQGAFLISPDNKGDDADYIVLQIHNGCDIRGGYTKPRVFKVVDFYAFLDGMDSVNAVCECTTMWSDDCGYHWYNYEGTFSDEKESYCLPKYWKPKQHKKGKYVLICSKCGKKVKFYPNFY